MIGVIDTGIDYRHQAFTYEDRTTKIYSIWDQTIRDGESPEGFIYGTEYTSEQINRALAAENSLAVVPSQDENGHGTFIAGVAAGRVFGGSTGCIFVYCQAEAMQAVFEAVLWNGGRCPCISGE